jgi:hypothetical protein
MNLRNVRNASLHFEFVGVGIAYLAWNSQFALHNPKVKLCNSKVKLCNPKVRLCQSTDSETHTHEQWSVLCGVVLYFALSCLFLILICSIRSVLWLCSCHQQS